MIQSKKSQPIIDYSSNAKLNLARWSQNKLCERSITSLIFSSIIAFLDLVFLVLTCVFMPTLAIIIPTSFLLVFDGLFIIYTLFGNQKTLYYRFYYSFFILISIILNVIMVLLSSSIIRDVFYLDTLSGVLLLSFKVLLVAGIIVNFFEPRHKDKRLPRVVSGFLFLVSIVLITIFYISSFGSGYYSNGITRKVVYTTNSDGTLTATDALSGVGNVISIPREYDGKKVKAVDVKLLTKNGINTLELPKGEIIDFIDDSDISSSQVNKMKIIVAKDNVEQYRDYFFDNTNRALSIHNLVVPKVNKDEVYYKFNLSNDCLPLEYESTLLPIWIGKKGETFNPATYLSLKKYHDYASDYEYCFESFAGVRLLSKLDPETIINKSVNYDLKFENIYKVQRVTDYNYAGDFGATYAYVTDSNYQALNLNLERFGCTTKWIYNYSTFETTMYEELVKEFKEDNNHAPKISCVWEPKDFSDIKFTSVDTKYVYGDDVKFNVGVEHELPVTMEIRNGIESFDVSDMSIVNIGILIPGTYVLSLVVKATDPYDSRISIESSQKLIQQVFEKSITVVWPEKNSYEYDGSEHTLDHYPFDTTQLLDQDVLDVKVSYSNDSFKNVSSYYASAILSGEAADCYSVSNSTFFYEVKPKEISLVVNCTTGESVNNIVYSGSQKQVVLSIDEDDLCGTDVCNIIDKKGTFIATDAGDYSCSISLNNSNYELNHSIYTWTIKPYKIDLTWGSTILTYNGEYQFPRASALTLDGQPLGILYSQGYKNVGNYSNTASTSNSNYLIGNNVADYQIIPKNTTIDWTTTEFTYDGLYHKPTASMNYVGTDKDLLTTTGEYKNAGAYTCSASIDSDNYEITENQTCLFVINKRVARITYSNDNSFIYDKSTHAITASVTNLISGDDLSVNLLASAKIAAGNYIAKFSSLSGDVENYADPTTNLTYNWSIIPKEIKGTWQNLTFTYDGNSHQPYLTAIPIDGDDLGLSVSGSAINVGTYKATASITNSNYNLISTETEYVINKKEIEVIWTNDTFIYDGTDHVDEIIPYIMIDGVKTVLSLDSGVVIKEIMSYVVIVSFDNSNYALTNSTKVITVKGGE